MGVVGSSLTDVGIPFGASVTVPADGSSEGAPSGADGYSLVEGDSLEDAVTMTKGCRVLDGGGPVEVFEAVAM